MPQYIINLDDESNEAPQQLSHKFNLLPDKMCLQNQKNLVIEEEQEELFDDESNEASQQLSHKFNLLPDKMCLQNQKNLVIEEEQEEL